MWPRMAHTTETGFKPAHGCELPKGVVYPRVTLQNNGRPVCRTQAGRLFFITLLATAN